MAGFKRPLGCIGILKISHLSSVAVSLFFFYLHNNNAKYIYVYHEQCDIECNLLIVFSLPGRNIRKITKKRSRKKKHDSIGSENEPTIVKRNVGSRYSPKFEKFLPNKYLPRYLNYLLIFQSR